MEWKVGETLMQIGQQEAVEKVLGELGLVGWGVVEGKDKGFAG